MSTVQTWALWQRMPPRYQLTSKCLLDDQDELVANCNVPERATTPKKSASPRPFSAGNISPPLTSRQIPLRDTNFMLSSSVTEPVQNLVKAATKSTQPKGASFPKRSSDYINTFQKQCRVNSARRRLAEVPPTPNRTSTHISNKAQALTSHRAKTAPVFPVTNPDTHQARKSTLGDNPCVSDFVTGKNVTAKTSKHIGESSKGDTFYFEDAKSSVSSSGTNVHLKMRDQEPKAKKYVVQDTNRATVYIDNGKVMYFGKSRHDLTQLLKTQSLRADRSGCFLAEIRRDYLKHPKFERSVTGSVSRSDNDPRRIANERVDYNRRVQHILSYYDDNQTDSRCSLARPTSVSRMKGSKAKGLSLLSTPPGTRPTSASSTPEPKDSLPNDFIRFNKQAKIHKRQFYLRTPGIPHGGTVADLEKCRCSMCRMELQLAMVTGPNQDANLAMVAAANETMIQGKSIHPFSSDSKGGVVFSEAAVPRKHGSRQNSQRVTFQKHEEKETNSESNKMRINCKLPEVTDLPVSESGFESSRTQDADSTYGEDVTDC